MALGVIYDDDNFIIYRGDAPPPRPGRARVILGYNCTEEQTAVER